MTAALLFASAPAYAIPDLSNLRSIMDGISEGTWTKVNINNFSETWPANADRTKLGYGNNPQQVIGAWSSFAWDDKRGDLIIYGGGHANYSGNEVYRWSGVTQLWSRASLPSQVSIVVDTKGYQNYLPLDGALNAPQSAHTYDNSLYLPISDRFVTFGGASTNSGGALVKQTGSNTVLPTGPYFWDPSKADASKVGGTTGSGVNPSTLGGQMWNNRDYLVNSNLATSTVKPMSFLQGTTAYRTENGKDVVYVTATAGSASFQNLWKMTINDVNDPSRDTWEMVGLGWGGVNLGAGALDDDSNVFVRIGNTSSLTVWDLNNAGPTNRSVGITVTAQNGSPMSLLGGGLEYDPIRDRLLFWNGGGDVWSLEVPDRLANGNLPSSGWTFVKLDGTSPAVPETLSTGINGKWDYVAQLDAFMGLVDRNEGEVWLYKPQEWSPAAVPEPGTFTMMAIGAGVVFLVLRRRSRSYQFSSIPRTIH